MPPAALRSAAYAGAKKLGRGEGYIYPHANTAGFEVDCLPEKLAGSVYYEPSGIGEEVERERSARAQPAEPPRTGRE
jgi:putative ATPase